MTIQYPGRRVLVPTPNLGGVRIFQPVVSGISYLLRDEFITDLPAGSVNGTAAEPGPGTRTVVDTGTVLSVSGGALTCAVPTAIADPAVYYETQARTAGRVALLGVFNATNRGYFGFDNALSGAPQQQTFYKVSTDLSVYDNIVQIPVATVLNSIDYSLAIVLRSQGAYFFIKGNAFTNWELLWMGREDASANLYPVIAWRLGAMSVDSIRIPDLLWLPTPVAYDSFTRANGALGTSETSGPDGQAVTGRTWNFDAGIWTVDTNKAKGSPVAGGELVVNGDFSAWTGDDPDGWSIIENPPDTEVSEVGAGEGHGGVGSGMCNLYRNVGSSPDPSIYKTILTVGNWYIVTVLIDTVVSGSIVVQDAGGGIATTYSAPGSKTQTGRAAHGGFRVRCTVGTDITIDDISVKALALSELFASVDDAGTSNVVVSVDVTLGSNTPAGIVMNLDNEETPANFVIGYHDGVNAKLEKCVGGTYTTVISAAAAYVAGATLVVIKDGNDYSLFYNNAKIGSTSTISDAGIVSNTKHGLFSTYSGNRLDNFTLFPRGTGGEYSDLDDY